MATKKNEYNPETVSHPGLTLGEKLIEIGMSIKAFALRSGKPEKTIIGIIEGSSSITSDMAVQFESVLKIPANFWLKRQRSYDESLSRLKRLEVIEGAYAWARSFPYAKMASEGWVIRTSKVEEKVVALFDFFGVANAKAWEDYYYSAKLKVDFRISLKQTQESYAVSAWLRRGEIQAAQIIIPTYDEKKLKQTLPLIKVLMAEHPDNFFEKLQSLCFNCGVKVVYTPNLPKAPIHGSTRWINGTPILQLSARYRQNDRFWFTFFHEIGHIILHGTKYISIENVDYADRDASKEQEADDFAIDWTFSEKEEAEILQYATDEGALNEEDVLAFAEKFGTHPAMIIGRFQHKGKIAYNTGRMFMKKVDLAS